MKWIVYCHEFNSDRIETFNVFDHDGFNREVLTHLKKYRTRDSFAEALRRSLFYYFCSKCEWEVIISPWVGSRNNEGIKVDVYQQVMNNWDIFVDYVWTH
jgi:hypothetical protein